MEEDFVYVLLVGNNVNGAGEEHDILVFRNLESAQLKLKELKDRFLAEIKNELECWEIDDNSNDDFLASFEAWEDGFYNEHHFTLIIYQREINE